MTPMAAPGGTRGGQRRAWKGQTGRALPAGTIPIYFHCSIGDLELSKEELAAELAASQNGALESEKDAAASTQNQ